MRFVKSIAFILTFLTLSFSQTTIDVLYDSDVLCFYSTSSSSGNQVDGLPLDWSQTSI